MRGAWDAGLLEIGMGTYWSDLNTSPRTAARRSPWRYWHVETKRALDRPPVQQNNVHPVEASLKCIKTDRLTRAVRNEAARCIARKGGGKTHSR